MMALKAVKASSPIVFMNSPPAFSMAFMSFMPLGEARKAENRSARSAMPLAAWRMNGDIAWNTTPRFLAMS